MTWRLGVKRATGLPPTISCSLNLFLENGYIIMTKFITKFVQDESGATAIEYGLIAALIAVAIIGIVGTLGGQLKAAFTSVSEGMTPKP
jgi:pilus assembly protein Flp/PilA